MEKINVIIALVLTMMLCLLNVGLAQESPTNQQYNPERVLQFLDKDKDEKISQQEASKAKRLMGRFTHLDTNSDGYLTLAELKRSTTSSRYTYIESDGVFMYYETEGRELYRELLPKEFEMPERLLVYVFVSDFYKMDAETTPYKETAMFLLGKYKGKDIWHCIYMPVTSEESMLAGKYRLGLPKTIGDINFLRSEPEYKATLIDQDNCQVSLSVNTDNHTFTTEQKELLKQLSTMPKMNILNGEVIEMSGGRNSNIFDLAQKYPNGIILKSGEGSIAFDTSAQKNNTSASPLNLKPIKILGTYYMLNKIPFRLGKK